VEFTPQLRPSINPVLKSHRLNTLNDRSQKTEFLGQALGWGGEPKRWIAPWAGSETKAAIYHCISRVVDRRFVFGGIEREHFRMFMRMSENFSGCRVLSYGIMSNHFHILLDVPPMPASGISDAELLKRLGAIHSEAAVAVAVVGKEPAEARETGNESHASEIHARFTYRMHDLSEFMKTLLQRFTRWFNRTRERSGSLWEERYKSVIVESGIAARTMAAYIDLNPVRAGMVSDPADYRWSSYGEAVGGGNKGNGKKSWEGLVRACMSHHGVGFEADRWKEVSRVYRRTMDLALGRKSGRAEIENGKVRRPLNTAEAMEAENNESALPDQGVAAMLRCRVRYFTDGAVIGSKAFVNEAFAGARERFTVKCKDGARRMRGSGEPENRRLDCCGARVICG
jgi:putative transposase